MQTIAIHTHRGGTGKTTTALCLAFYALAKGKKVLLVDLDAQCNLSASLQYDTEAVKYTSYDIINGKPAEQAIVHTEQGVDLIPASWQLSQLFTAKGTQHRLQKALEPLRNLYNVIILDTPPATGEIQYNALLAADKVVLPVSSDIYSYKSLQQVKEVIDGITEAGAKLKIAGIICTRYISRGRVNQQVREAIETYCKNNSIKYLGEIRESIAVKEAEILCENLFTYAPKSNATKDYIAAFDKLKI